MNNKSLLVSSITLLFRESQLITATENSAVLVRDIVANMNLAGVNLGIDHERDILTSLRSTALSMCEVPHDHKYETSEMLQRLKINCGEDISVYEAFKEGIQLDLDDEAVKRTCLNIKRTLNNHFREKKIDEIVTKAHHQLKFERNKIKDMKSYVADFLTALEPYQVDNIVSDPGILRSVDLSNKEEVLGIFSDVKQIQEGGAMLKFGYQGLNRLLGGAGIRRGESMVNAALQHNWKTGLSLTMFLQIARYNIPVNIEPNKKPLLIRFSCEDDLQLNFQFMYKSLIENETGKLADMSLVSKEQMQEYCMLKMQETGFHVQLHRVDPSNWSYKGLCNKILQLEADGYEVHFCQIDYLKKLPTTGCDTGPMGHDIRDMYRRVRNFMSAHAIAFSTPHQLSSEAKMLIREGRDETEFVKTLVGKGYYDGCKTLENEVDIEIYHHIVKVNGIAYLVFQRGKHRKTEITPDEFLYFALPFLPQGVILDDINGPDSTRKKPGAGPLGSVDENPFWDNF